MKITLALLTFFFIGSFFIYSGCSTTPDTTFQVDPYELKGKKLKFTYIQLKTKDYGDMKKLVDRFLKRHDQLNESAPLKKALRIVLSRPDSDALMIKFLPSITASLDDIRALDSTFVELTNEALHRTKARHGTIDEQATYVILLENLVYELKAQKKSWPLAVKLLEKIYEADIKISSNVKESLELRIMKNPVYSPSFLARIALYGNKDPEESELPDPLILDN